MISFTFLATCLLSLVGCGRQTTGTIYFDLDGGHFLDPSFSTSKLTGVSGTPVKISIPDPVKEGYYFIGWRELKKDGTLSNINKRKASDGKSYYYYPYVDFTFYAYFEKEISISFSLTDSSSDAFLIEPEKGASDFVDNKLKGYANKVIPSLKYLPVADDKKNHLNFEGWYTKYPLIKETGEKDQTHYVLDLTEEEGQYMFESAFGNDKMQFPLSDETFTLYAKWSLDPTIRVHTNLDTVADFSFLSSQNVEEDITSAIKDVFSYDMKNETGDTFYYPLDTRENRFAGFFLDEEFTKPFYINSVIGQEDIDIFMKWNKKVDVTFDYNGGLLNGVTSELLSGDHYQDDILGEEVLKEHIPTLYGHDFTNYTLDGSIYDFIYDRLPDHDITLLASYAQYPILNLSHDYPLNYSGERLQDVSYSLQSGTQLTSYLDSFINAFHSDDLESSYFYQDDGTTKIENLFLSMPDSSLDLKLELDYKNVVTVKTLIGSSDEPYGLSTTYQDITFKYGREGKVYESESSSIPYVQESDIPDIYSQLVENGFKYLFDGTYDDIDLTSKTIYPFYQETSHQQINSRTIYRKMTKGIDLTFYRYDDSSSLDLSISVIPSSTLLDSEERLKDLLGDYKDLYLSIQGEYVRIERELPDTSCNVFVRY